MLWDTTYPTVDILSLLNDLNRVWVVELTGSPDNVQSTDVHTLESAGYTLTSTQLVHRTIIYLFVKS